MDKNFNLPPGVLARDIETGESHECSTCNGNGHIGSQCCGKLAVGGYCMECGKEAGNEDCNDCNGDGVVYE